MLQYNEYYNERTGLTVGIRKVLFSRQSEFQRVEVFETDTWGNLMVIDGMVMLSERDEFVYHEMLVHPALATHPDPKRVLIIGGGDGGSAREVLKHSSVEQVDLVEIDVTVVEAAKSWLPDVGAFDDPRLHLYVEDGIDFVKNQSGSYDVIIVDGSDPVGPAEGLFKASFIDACHNALRSDGVVSLQSESPWVESYHTGMRGVWNALNSTFTHSEVFLSWIPLYPGGMWSMMIGSKKIHPLEPDVLNRSGELEKNLGSLSYYNRKVHQGAFALPNFVAEIFIDRDE
ncbi:MAG: polyamine aminopropyltransferase [Balneolaceae bacterium]